MFMGQSTVGTQVFAYGKLAVALNSQRDSMLLGGPLAVKRKYADCTSRLCQLCPLWVCLQIGHPEMQLFIIRFPIEHPLNIIKHPLNIH